MPHELQQPHGDEFFLNNRLSYEHHISCHKHTLSEIKCYLINDQISNSILSTGCMAEMIFVHLKEGGSFFLHSSMLK